MNLQAMPGPRAGMCGPFLSALPILSRVCHKLIKSASLDWVPMPRWVDCAGNVLRAGLVQFPDSSYLNIHLGSFEAVLRQEPSVGQG